MSKDGRSDSLEAILGEIDSTLAGTGGIGDSTLSSSMGEMSLSELLKGVGISPPSNGSGNGDLASLLRADDDFADIFGDEPGLSISQGMASSGAPVSTAGGASAATGEGNTAGAAGMDTSSGGASSTKLLQTLDVDQQRDFLKWLEDDAPLPPSLSSIPPPPDASTKGGAALKAPSPPVRVSPSVPVPPPVPPPSSPSPAPFFPSPVDAGDTWFLPAGLSKEALLERLRTELGLAPTGQQDGGSEPPLVKEDPPAPEAPSTGKEGEAAAPRVPSAHRVKVLCEEYGGVPTELRGHVWAALLPCEGGVCEALGRWEGALDLPCQHLVHRDAGAVARAIVALAQPQQEDGEGVCAALQEGVEGGVTFYCRLKGLDYHPTLPPALGAVTAVVGPTLPPPPATEGDKAEEAEGEGAHGPSPPEGIVGRFHSLTSAFLPYLLLSDTARASWVREGHSEFRLLLTYHAPILVQHLDRAVPGWEAPPPATVETPSLAHTEQVRQVEETEDLVGALEGRLPSTHRAREHRRGPSAGPSDSLTEVERAKQQEGREGGVLPTPWLLGLFAGCMPLQRMLELWDVCLLRGDRFLGFFLSLALVLHHKTELLSLQGPALRAAVESLFTNGRTPVLQGSEGGGSEGAGLRLGAWVEEADRLDRCTPVSFRVNLTAIELMAKRATALGADQRALSASLGLGVVRSPPRPGSSDPPPSTPLSPPRLLPDPLGMFTSLAPSHSASGGGLGASSSASSLSSRKQSDIDDLQATPHRWGLCSPARRRRSWVRSEEDLALLTKLTLTLAPEEAVPHMCYVSTRARATSPDAPALQDAGVGGIRYFGIDCRPKEHLSTGRFPTAYFLDPHALEEPEEIEKLLAMLESLKGSMHILLMGAGDRSGFVSSHGVEKAVKIKEQLRRAAREDVCHLNNCALFLLKHGFPYVSILEGGYVAAHSYLLHRRGPSLYSLSSLVDHSPSQCRMCKHEALLRFHRDRGLQQGGNMPPIPTTGGLSGSEVGGSRGEGGLAGVGAQLLGPGGLESLKSKGLGLLERISSARAGAAGAGGGAQVGQGGEPATLEEIGNMLKGTLGQLTRKSTAYVQQAAKRTPPPQPPPHSGLNLQSLGGRSRTNSGSNLSYSPNAEAGPQPLPPTANAAGAGLSGEGPTGEGAGDQAIGRHRKSMGSGPVFVIEDDDEEDMEEGEGGHVRSPVNATQAVGGASVGVPVVRKSEADRELALKLHMVNGLQKGQEVLISTEALPGAQLFLVDKVKPQPDDKPALLLPRYLAVTPERLLVLYTTEGLNSNGTVKSNHHLTELGKMTFMRKDPCVVTLYFRVPQPDPSAPEQLKKRTYRIPRKDAFITLLQDNLKRFK